MFSTGEEGEVDVQLLTGCLKLRSFIKIWHRKIDSTVISATLSAVNIIALVVVVPSNASWTIRKDGRV